VNDHQQTIVRTCLASAEDGSMTFPQIVASLAAAGIERYAVDFQQRTTTYFLPDGEALELAMHAVTTPVAPALDAAALQAAIREAQQLVPGYTYRGFCEKAAAAGCAGYIVSLSGRRALYIARTAETHVELFPPAA
jgi:uncharacterized protein YbcV (DUF1398 family)